MCSQLNKRLAFKRDVLCLNTCFQTVSLKSFAFESNFSHHTECYCWQNNGYFSTYFVSLDIFKRVKLVNCLKDIRSCLLTWISNICLHSTFRSKKQPFKLACPVQSSAMHLMQTLEWSGINQTVGWNCVHFYLPGREVSKTGQCCAQEAASVFPPLLAWKPLGGIDLRSKWELDA